jgi:hypothetical protein
MVKFCAVVFGSDPSLWMLGEVGRGEAAFISRPGVRARHTAVTPHTYTTEREHTVHTTVTQQLHHSQVPNIHVCSRREFARESCGHGSELSDTV